ncbi:conserved hypothetical protein [Candidatus Terasakiella magnetica]|nr:conserved hypothetical protein [Candidatus Terasakiella magnetica]
MTTQLWFERIGWGQVLFGLIRHGWWRQLRFLSPRWSRSALRLVQLLARVSHGRIDGEQRILELGRVDGAGRALLYRREQLMLVVSQAFAQAPGPLPASFTQEEFSQLLGSYVVTKIQSAIAMTAIVEAEYGTCDKKTICYMSFPAIGKFTAEILNIYTKSNLTIVPWLNLRAVIEYIRFIPGHPRQWLPLLFRHPFEAAAIAEEGRRAGLVLEEAYWLSLHHYPSSGHMYWAESSGLPATQVALYCDRSDTPCDAHLRGLAAKHGFGWIDGAELLRHSDNPRRDVMAALKDTWRLLVFGFGPTSWLRWALATGGTIRVGCYRQMLRRHNVVALHHFTEFSPEGLALSLAARREDVLTLWNLWSVMPTLVARYHWAMADLILAWGPLDRDYHRACGFRYKAIAEVGQIDADGFAPEDETGARDLRARMHPATRFVITAFDTGFGPLVHNSEDHLRTFFSTIIDLVERNSQWGLIIKPKKRPEESGALSLSGRLLALERQGRCLILEPRFKVGVAALAADVVVGIPINSAAELGALRGRPTLHLDLTGLIDGPLYHSGKAAGIIHSEVGSFVQAIERIARGEPSGIDRSAWADLIDRFNDQAGRHRAGALVGDFVRMRQSLSADRALEAAMAHYAAEYGKDRVTFPDTQDESLWAPIPHPEALSPRTPRRR